MPAVYDPANDRTQNMPASNMDPNFDPDQTAAPGSRYAQVPAPNPMNPMRPPEPPRPEGVGTGQSQGMALFQQGEAALRAHDTTRAYELFRQAANHPNDLDPDTAQRLQDHLQLLSPPSRMNPANLAGQSPTMSQPGGRSTTVAAQSDPSRSGPPRIERQGHAGDRSQGRAGDVGGDPQEGRNDQRTRACNPRSISAKRRSRDCRDEAGHRPESSADRTEREEQSHPPGRRTSAAGEGGSASEDRYEDRPVQQAHGRAALCGGRCHRQAGRRARPQRAGREPGARPKQS